MKRLAGADKTLHQTQRRIGPRCPRQDVRREGVEASGPPPLNVVVASLLPRASQTTSLTCEASKSCGTIRYLVGPQASSDRLVGRSFQPAFSGDLGITQGSKG